MENRTKEYSNLDDWLEEQQREGLLRDVNDKEEEGRDSDDPYRTSVADISPESVVMDPNNKLEDYTHRNISGAPDFMSSTLSGGLGPMIPPLDLFSPQFGGAVYDASFLAPLDFGKSEPAPFHRYADQEDVDSENYITVVPELPDLPGFLEEQTHVCVPVQLVQPQDLAQWVEDTLQQFKADYTFQAKKCKWKAARCSKQVFVDFRIRLYSRGTELIVEFQRRKGDFLFMHEVFDQFTRLVDKQKEQGLLVPKQKDPSSTSKVDIVESAASLVPLVLAQDACNEEAELLESVSALVKMASSPCRITSYEAVNAIAKLSSSEDNRNLLRDAGAISVLVNLLKRTDCNEVQQAVMSALSNLSESASCKASIVEAGALPRLLKLVANPETQSRRHLELEMRRESARILANLSEDYAQTIVTESGKENVVKWIQSVGSLSDDRLRMHARRIQNRVRCCC